MSTLSAHEERKLKTKALASKLKEARNIFESIEENWDDFNFTIANKDYRAKALDYHNHINNKQEI